MSDLDFPVSPTLGQQYAGPNGILYTFDGFGWVAGESALSVAETTVSQFLQQVRVLLQDTDQTEGGYRYLTDSLIANLNMGVAELYRIRPDVFLATNFIIPTYTEGMGPLPLNVEEQFVPPLVYYVVGLTQARDDEQTQDQRAAAFLNTFQRAVLSNTVMPVAAG